MGWEGWFSIGVTSLCFAMLAMIILVLMVLLVASGWLSVC